MATKRALIVDDSTTAQYRLKKMLRPYGLHIDIMDSGEAALRYLATNEPDVIFMDHLMPGMDGFRVLQIIKSHPETATIPVIMYTSKSGDVYTGQARALGALDVVSKDTINAADLSKVLQTIHIAREEKKLPDGDATGALERNSADDSAAFIAAANGVSEPAAPLIDRRAPSSASLEQARNLELRLGHLESTLEDSRRFITTRVVRELDSLRQNLKQEFSAVISHNHPAEPLLYNEPQVRSSGGGWAMLSVLLVVILFVMGVIYFEKIDSSISQSQVQQALLAEQLNNIAIEQKKNIQKIAQTTAVEKSPDAAAPDSNGYLADSVWAFNQSGAVPFTQNNLDPKMAIRLHEFIARIINSGFRGNVLINIFVGNFCVFTDSLGQAQLAMDNATMNNCMLSSEVYGLDRVIKQYSSEIETVMGNLSRQQKSAVNIVISGAPGTLVYPDRQASTPVKDWNSIAQANNRLELRLELSSPQ